MPTELDRAYQRPLDAAGEAILRASDSTKARLFDALQEATAAFLATVVAEATAGTLREVVNAGLVRLSRQAVDAIQQAAEEAAQRQAEAHAAGYAAAASAADADVPGWEPDRPIVAGIERGDCHRLFGPVFVNQMRDAPALSLDLLAECADMVGRRGVVGILQLSGEIVITVGQAFALGAEYVRRCHAMPRLLLVLGWVMIWLY